MEQQSFTMMNLASREISGNIEYLIELVGAIELYNYEEGRFQNGPTMVEFRPTDVGNDDQKFKVLLPVNEEVEFENDDGVYWEWIPEIHLEKVLRSRVPFDEGIEEELKKMKEFLQNKNFDYEDRLILIFSKIYEEYWVDMVIPYV